MLLRGHTGSRVPRGHTVSGYWGGTGGEDAADTQGQGYGGDTGTVGQSPHCELQHPTGQAGAPWASRPCTPAPRPHGGPVPAAPLSGSSASLAPFLAGTGGAVEGGGHGGWNSAGGGGSSNQPASASKINAAAAPNWDKSLPAARAAWAGAPGPSRAARCPPQGPRTPQLCAHPQSGATPPCPGHPVCPPAPHPPIVPAWGWGQAAPPPGGPNGGRGSQGLRKPLSAGCRLGGWRQEGPAPHGGRPRTPRGPLPPGHHEPQRAPTTQTPRARGGGRLDPRGLHRPCTRIPPGPPPRHDPQFGEASALRAAENTQLEGEREEALSTPWIQPISPPKYTSPHHVALSRPRGPADPWGSPQSPQSLGLHSRGGQPQHPHILGTAPTTPHSPGHSRGPPASQGDSGTP